MRNILFYREKLKKNDWIFIFSALTIPVIQFIVFFVIVNAKSFLMAFQNTADGINYTWAGLSTMKNALTTLFTDVNYGIVMKNTFSLYFWTQIAMGFLSIFFAYCIWKKAWGWKFFSIVLFLPSVISSVTFVMVTRKLVNGYLPIVFDNPQLVTLFNPLTTGFEATTALTCFLSFGSTLVLYLGAMSQVDKSLLEYGELDGMNAFHEFVYIVFPHIWPTIISMTIIGLATMLSNSGLLIAFYGTGSGEVEIQTFASKMYMIVYNKVYSNYTMLSAMGLFFTIIVVILSYVLRKSMGKWGPKEE